MRVSLPPLPLSYVPATPENCVPGVAAAVASDPAAFLSKFSPYQGDRYKSDVARAIWRHAKPAHARGATAEDRVAAIVKVHPTAKAAVIGAWCARAWGLFGEGQPDSSPGTLRSSAIRLAWNTRNQDDPVIPAGVTASEMLLACQQLVAHVISSCPVLSQVVRDAGVWDSVEAVERAGATGNVHVSGEDGLSQLPCGLMGALCARYGKLTKPLADDEVDAVRQLVPWLVDALNKADQDGLLAQEAAPGVLQADHRAATLLFSTVFRVLGEPEAHVRRLADMFACYYRAECSPQRLSYAVEAVARLPTRAISILYAVAKGVQIHTRTRFAPLDYQTVARQRDVVARIGHGMSGRGVFLFCGLCGKPAVPLKPQIRGRVSRQVKPHAKYSAIINKQGDAPLKPDEKHTSVGFDAMLRLETDPYEAGVIGTYVCMAATHPECAQTPVCAVDLRGVVFRHGNRAYQICERCGGFFVHHAQSRWFGTARVCDSCDITPRMTKCPVCSLRFNPLATSNGIARTCSACFSSCARCKKAVPPDTYASVNGEAVACDACAASCSKCGSEAAAWSVASRGRLKGLCEPCHLLCGVCGRPAGPNANREFPERSVCQRCVAAREAADRRRFASVMNIDNSNTTTQVTAARLRANMARIEAAENADEIATIVRRVRKRAAAFE